MTTKPVVLVLLACLLMAGTYQRNYTEIYDTYCKGSSLTAETMSEADRAARRASQRGVFVSVASIVDVIQNKSAGKILKEAGAYVILMIILTIFCLFSFISFMGFCCCCDRSANNTVRKSKIYTFLTVVFIVVFLALFIALLVFLGRLNTNRNETGCAIASVPTDILNGVSTPNLKFLGFIQLAGILSNFKNDLNSISSLTKDFDNIINQDLPAASRAALVSLPNFYNKYKSSTTTDGTGVLVSPQTVTTLTENINDAIYTEFTIYNEVSVKITSAAQTGKSYSQNTGVALVQASLESVITQLNNITNQVTNVFGTAVTGIDYFNQYAPIGYWLTLAFGLLICILGVIAVILIALMIKRSNDRCRMGVKFCLSFNGFLIFLLGIISVVLLVASISLGTVCNAVGTVLTATDVAAQVASFGVSIDPTVNTIINQCMPYGAKGDISSLLSGNSTIYSQSQGFLDGLTLYDSLKNNITAQGSISPTISATVAVWKNAQLSIYPDHLNTLNTLGQLNNLISCDGKSFQLNAQNCTQSGCSGIFDTSSFTAPSCSSNSNQASTYFNTLKKFTTDENTLVGGMISDLSGTGPNTPQTLNIASRDKIKSVFTNFDQIKSKLQNTVNLVTNMTSGFAANLNCTVLRLELDNLENTFCFKFNQSLYYFAVLLIWIVFFLFFYSWCICYALKYMPTAESNIYSQKVAHDANFYAQDEEKTPVY